MRRPGAGGREEKKSLAGSRMEEDLSLTSFPGGTEAESKRQRGVGRGRLKAECHSTILAP